MYYIIIYRPTLIVKHEQIPFLLKHKICALIKNRKYIYVFFERKSKLYISYDCPYLWSREPKILILQTSYMVKFPAGRCTALMDF